MPLDAERLSVARKRTTQVFRFLEEVNRRKNPIVRQINEQIWSLWFCDLPDHECIQQGTYAEATDTDLPARQDDFVLKIKRAEVTAPPELPLPLEEWRQGNYENPDQSPEFLKQKERPVVLDTGGEVTEDETEEVRKVNVEEFGASEDRVALWNAWLSEWKLWAEKEKPNRAAFHLFEQFYARYSQIAREGESVEMVIGDGILNWSVSEGVISHPVLLQRLTLTFVPETPEFIVRETDDAIELYSALVSGVTGVDGALIGKSREQLQAGGYHPLGGESTTEFLESFVASLAAQGQLVESNRLTDVKQYPRLYRSPVLLMRKRSLGFATALEAILEDVQEREEIPASLLNIIGIEPPSPEISDSEGGASFAVEPQDVLLSKPANAEQIQIAQRLDQHNCVLVQGPPGTGKTHTIANLVGHLLAQGKSVLITSHTTKALRVLRDQIVPQLQPLCVSVLDGGAESKQQLESSIAGIVDRLSSSDVTALDNQASLLASRRTELLRRYSETRMDLLHARQDEYREIVVAGQSYSPIVAARLVAKDETGNKWIPTPVALGEPLPLSESELVELYRTNVTVSQDDERELAVTLPALDAVVAPDAFAQIIKARQSLGQRQAIRDDAWSMSPNEQNPNVLAGLVQWASEAVAAFSEEPWKLTLLDAGRQGPPHIDIWLSLVAAIEQLYERSIHAQGTLIEQAPVLSSKTSASEQLALLEEITQHLKSGGQLSWFVLLQHKKWKELIPDLRVNDREPKSLQDFQALHTLAVIEVERKALISRWERQVVAIGGPPLAASGITVEQAGKQFVEPIRRSLAWYKDKLAPLVTALPAQGLKWESLLQEEPPILSPNGDLLRLRNTLTNRLVPILRSRIELLRWLAIEKQFAAAKLPLQQSGSGAEVVQHLLKAVDGIDAEGYEHAYERLAELHQKRSEVVKRHELLTRLERAAPGWAAAVRDRVGVHGGREIPGVPAEGWMWRQLHDDLEKRSKASLDALQRQVETLRHDLQMVTAELVDQKAWGYQIRRTTKPQRQALLGWLQTVRRIGKGTGMRVPKLQAEARKQMSAAKTSVPVWIMPLSRVVESFMAGGNRFDVVITDEASQSDVMGLIALYLGNQVVVVGDHEQVSPDAVAQRLDVVDQLINTHLQGIPNAPLYDGQQSIYDLAMRSFGGMISLREHFRCVPDIIQFSNDLSYNGRIKPLRDASSVALKPATIAYRVEGASAANKVNNEEAITVASLLMAAVKQPEYAEASFGVISLVGEEQARTIETILRLRMLPLDYEKRRIVCGTPPQFQGDERDVMFLSVVDSGREDSGRLTLREADLFKKRYNVAASRAKDQMWVVHSLNPSADLKPEDLRRRLIEHAQNPHSLSLEIERGTAKTESEFEKQVLRRLVTAGFKVVPQWQVGAYRIDMVVEGSENRLAVECDGEQFHTQDDLAADMDRQAVLERLGWKFVRIRGSEFFRDADRAMEPVFRRLQELDIEPSLKLDTTQGTETQKNELVERVIRRAGELRREWKGESADDVSEADVSSAVQDEVLLVPPTDDFVLSKTLFEGNLSMNF